MGQHIKKKTKETIIKQPNNKVHCEDDVHVNQPQTSLAPPPSYYEAVDISKLPDMMTTHM